MTPTASPVRRFLPSALLAVGVLLVLSARSQTAVPLAGALATVLPAWQDLRITNQKISDEEQRIAGMTDYVARVLPPSSRQSVVAPHASARDNFAVLGTVP